MFSKYGRNQPWGLPSLLANGYGGLFSKEVKRPRLEVDHSLSSSADVKDTWSYTSSTPYVLVAWYLGKRRDNSTFAFACTDSQSGCVSHGYSFLHHPFSLL
jgi:hypothetical protein